MVSDVLQAWVEQLVVQQSIHVFRWVESTANDRARAARKKHPLPAGVSFIFCQAEACVVGKRSDARGSATGDCPAAELPY